MVTLAVLLMRRSALGLTVSVAVAVIVLFPTDVVNEPGGIVFVPLSKPVTTTETEHDAPGGITVPELTLSEDAPCAAVTIEFAHVVAGKGAAELLIPSG